nr:immunoglobulin light chain junction region [Macaca mulatta]MOW11284.1 immunoglobulin light chain junction region [Macaca mulatta]
CMQGVEFPWTF